MYGYSMVRYFVSRPVSIVHMMLQHVTTYLTCLTCWFSVVDNQARSSYLQEISISTIESYYFSCRLSIHLPI
jgi:hypothetical protein